MAPLIEDQMHLHLIEQEDLRCRLLEQERQKAGVTEKKSIKRRLIRKPWRRAANKSLCQDVELLQMVIVFDYDLSDPTFQAYCETRGVLHVAGDSGSKRWQYFEDFTKEEKEFNADSYFRQAETINGKSHRYSSDEMKVLWKTICIGRAKLQDCWEVYKRLEQR